jgi:hypothetical protein
MVATVSTSQNKQRWNKEESTCARYNKCGYAQKEKIVCCGDCDLVLKNSPCPDKCSKYEVEQCRKLHPQNWNKKLKG